MEQDDSRESDVFVHIGRDHEKTIKSRQLAVNFNFRKVLGLKMFGGEGGYCVCTCWAEQSY
jgi:hypothetical protein